MEGIARVSLLGPKVSSWETGLPLPPVEPAPIFESQPTSPPMPVDEFDIGGLKELLEELAPAPAPADPRPQKPKPQPKPQKPKPAKPKPKPKPDPRPEPKPLPGPSYTIAHGDTLGKIAERMLGDAGRWREIHALNQAKIPDPNAISPGVTITLPKRAKLPDPPAPSSYFMNQMRSANNPDAPAYTLNCGPTALAMAARAFGKPFAGGTVQQQINQSLLASTGTIDHYAGTWPNQLMAGARKAGLSTYGISSTLAALDSALAKGNMVIAWGYPRYASNFSPSQYHYAYGRPYNDGHYILVTGKTKDGRYLINDSLSKMGPLTITREQMANYCNFSRNDELIWSVVVGPGT